MSQFKVVLIEHGYASIDVERGIIERAGGEFIDADQVPLAEALRLCEDADGILFRRIDITAEMLRRFRRCKILLRYGVGTDNVPSAAATDAGIMVGHVPAYCIDEVSTHAIALLLACVRKVVVTHRKMEGGGWDLHREDPIFRMTGRTLGLVGLGHIGQAVARKLGAWGLTLLAADPFVEPARAGALDVKLVELDSLCRESDFVSLHCPLLAETRHLIGDRAFSLMKPGAILINTSRGPVVDASALLAALETGRLACAGLDVFEEEPPGKSPLYELPNVVVTPHAAGTDLQSRDDMALSAAQSIIALSKGEWPTPQIVNPDAKAKFKWE